MDYKKSFLQWLIPICTFMFLVFIFSYISWQHISSEKDNIHLQTQITGEQTKLHLESWIDERIQIVKQLSIDFAANEKIDSTLFITRAEELRNWFPGLQALNWIDPDFNISIVNPYPGNEGALKKNLLHHPYLSVRETIKKAFTKKQMVRTEIIELFQGGEAFTVYAPVVGKDKKIIGYINGVIKIDKLIKSSLKTELLKNRFHVTFSENDIPFYSNTLFYKEGYPEYKKTFTISVLDKNWHMALHPQEEIVAHVADANVTIYIFIMILISGVFTLFVHQTITRHYALKRSEEKFRTVVEQAGDAFYIINSERKIVQVNQQACDDLGYTRDELVGMHVNSLDGVHDEDTLNRISKQVDSRKMDQLETSHRRKDGTLIPVDIRFGVIDFNGKLYHLCLARNMTEPKRLQELESRAQRLETAGQIAGQVAHDFNNLLAPLMAYPDFIRELLDDDHPAHEYVNDIEQSAKQIAEINQQLLTLGRRGHYNQEIFNLNLPVKQVVRQFKNEFKNVTIHLQLEDNLLNINGGVSQISRIIMNMLHNAIDATEEKGIITLTTMNYYVDGRGSNKYQIPPGEYVKLILTDNGHGIPKDVLPNIFVPFMTTKQVDKKRGSGLGLSVVESVIKDHNGFIDVESIENMGTTFYVYFPITRKDISIHENNVVQGGEEKILVVDDDPGIRNVVEKILVQLGYDVTVVECGEIALDVLRDERFDLLILDMIIQNGMDGTETYQKAIKINPNQKAIIVSGFAESDRVSQALNTGVSLFIKKPFESRVLAAGVREALDAVPHAEKTLVS